MKILMLNSQGTGVGEYRNWLPARALKRLGHDVWWREEANPVEGLDVDKFLMEKASWADVVHTGFIAHLPWIQLFAAMRNYASKVLKKNLPLVTDIDDDIFHVPKYNVAFKDYAESGQTRRNVLWHLANSDALTVSTEQLTKLYDDRARQISLLPNCVDPADWAGLPIDPDRQRSGDIRLMFAGGIGRLDDVNEIRDALELVMRLRPRARLFFMGMMPDWAVELWANDPHDARKNRAFYILPTDVRTYRRILRWVSPDILLAPVVRNEFNRSKSHIKVLESPFVGAATVCTDWDTYATVPSEATLKATTTYEWKESLLALIDDPALRASKVAAALTWAQDMWHIDKHIHKWQDAYERAIAQPVITDEGEGMIEKLAVPA